MNYPELLKPAMSFREIGQRIGCSDEEARRLHESAMDKLFLILAIQWGLIPLDWEPGEPCQ